MEGDHPWLRLFDGVRSTPTVDGEFLFALGSDGDLACLETSTGKVRWPPDQPKHSRQMEKAWAYPVVANGRLYLRDHSSLWCYDVKTAR